MNERAKQILDQIAILENELADLAFMCCLCEQWFDKPWSRLSSASRQPICASCATKYPPRP